MAKDELSNLFNVAIDEDTVDIMSFNNREGELVEWVTADVTCCVGRFGKVALDKKSKRIIWSQNRKFTPVRPFREDIERAFFGSEEVKKLLK